MARILFTKHATEPSREAQTIESFFAASAVYATGMFNHLNQLDVYKGIKPTQLEVDPLEPANIGTFRTSDKLVAFNYSNSAMCYGNTRPSETEEACIVQLKPIMEGTIATALTSGIATWFVLRYHSTSYPAILVGDVTDVGGNGEMVMTDRNIVSGQAVTLEGFSAKLLASHDLIA